MPRFIIFTCIYITMLDNTMYSYAYISLILSLTQPPEGIRRPWEPFPRMAQSGMSVFRDETERICAYLCFLSINLYTHLFINTVTVYICVASSSFIYPHISVYFCIYLHTFVACVFHILHMHMYIHTLLYIATYIRIHMYIQRLMHIHTFPYTLYIYFSAVAAGPVPPAVYS